MNLFTMLLNSTQQPACLNHLPTLSRDLQAGQACSQASPGTSCQHTAQQRLPQEVPLPASSRQPAPTTTAVSNDMTFMPVCQQDLQPNAASSSLPAQHLDESGCLLRRHNGGSCARPVVFINKLVSTLLIPTSANEHRQPKAAQFPAEG